jgi:hypothetical protein
MYKLILTLCAIFVRRKGLYCGLAEVLSQTTKQDHVRKSQIREVAFAEVLKSNKLFKYANFRIYDYWNLSADHPPLVYFVF